MAIVRKISKDVEKAQRAPAEKAVKLDLKLETEPSEPPTAFGAYSALIYGNKGIGKTSLASRFPGAYFLSTEPGTKALRVLGSRVPDWDHFVGYVDLMVEEANPQRTVVVDIIDLAYDYIYDKICKSLMIDSPTEENDFGATWKKIRRLFREQITRLCELPGGVVFLSHDTEREIEMRDGTKIERVQPTMSKQALFEVEGLVDFIGHYHADGNERFMTIQPTQEVVAKCRPVEKFVVRGGKPGVGGDQVVRVPMGRSSLEAYENLIRAFNNQQETADGTNKPQAAAPAKPKLTIKHT